jgi:hypothetical protein
LDGPSAGFIRGYLVLSNCGVLAYKDGGTGQLAQLGIRTGLGWSQGAYEDSTPGTVGSASRLWQRRAEGLQVVVLACGTVLSFFSELVCNFRPFELNATWGIRRFWRFGTLSCRMPHISRKFGPSSRGSSFYCALCAHLLDRSRLCISCVHLCSRHSKLLASRRVDPQRVSRRTDRGPLRYLRRRLGPLRLLARLKLRHTRHGCASNADRCSFEVTRQLPQPT